MKKMLVVLTAMLLLSGCTNQKTCVINPSCDGFGLLSASRTDSTETLRQIVAHNATYRAICERGENGSTY